MVVVAVVVVVVVRHSASLLMMLFPPPLEIQSNFCFFSQVRSLRDSVCVSYLSGLQNPLVARIHAFQLQPFLPKLGVGKT